MYTWIQMFHSRVHRLRVHVNINSRFQPISLIQFDSHWKYYFLPTLYRPQSGKKVTLARNRAMLGWWTVWTHRNTRSYLFRYTAALYACTRINISENSAWSQCWGKPSYTVLNKLLIVMYARVGSWYKASLWPLYLWPCNPLRDDGHLHRVF